MFEIEVQSEFSAAHALKLYDGSYEPRHGHNWKVSVVMKSEGLDSIGVVHDFEDLKPNLKKILDGFHGMHINNHPDFQNDKLNSSTENIAKTIAEKLKSSLKSTTAKISRVTVWETPDASASYYPDKN